MGGGGSQDSTVTNVTQVDPVTQAWRSNIMQAGAGLYNQGVPNYYPGQTVVPFSNQTQSGLNYLQGYAGQGAPNLGAAQDASGRALSGFNPALPFAQNAAAGGLAGNQAIAGLQGFGGADNPHLRGLFDQGADMVRNAVGTQFAQAGRFGSGAAHTGALSRELGNLYTSIYAPAYEAERNRGLQAQQTIGALSDAGANRTLQGADLLGGIYSQGNEDAARAQALLPSLYSYGMMPGQSMLDVGGMYEGLAQNYLNADQDRYNYQANAPWDYLQRYAGMMSGLPDFSGSTQQTQGPQPNRLMQGLGAASVLGSLFSGGLFPGTLFPSDRRLKREITPLGAHINGVPLYSFAYLWDAPGKVRVGVMADEAPAHAVVEGPGGFAMVDYGAL